MPEISVILALRNPSLSHLTEALRSIQEQTYSDWELILVDDASTDPAVAYALQTFIEHEPKATLITNATRLGLPMSLNRGISAASGQYIARLDSDDRALPQRLESQRQYLVEGGFDLIGSRCQFIDAVGEVRATQPLPHLAHFTSRLFRGNFFAHSSLFGTRSAFHHPYNPAYPMAQDYELLLRLHSLGVRLGWQPDVVVQVRLHAASVSSHNPRRQEWYALKARGTALLQYHYPLPLVARLLRPAGLLMLPAAARKYLSQQR